MTEPIFSTWPELPGSKTVLCLGAHSDDIEIGCGGTLLRLANANTDLKVIWVVVAAGDEQRRSEAEASARSLLGGTPIDLRLASFRERYLHYDSDLKAFFDKLGSDVGPDLVFAPHTGDAHQDHRTVADLTWNTFRTEPIWEYEIVKYEGDLGHPNLFVPLSEEDLESKLSHLSTAFPSQRLRYWFTPETFRALARIRGVECRSESGYAEAFHVRKMVMK